MGNKAILVTGGAGYIGSHACKELSKAGYIPVTYDNLVYGHEWAVKWGPLEVGDIADRHRLDAVIKQYEPSAVMHFAAYAYVGESVTEPFKYYRNNVAGTLTLLEAMREHDVNNIVFSSTCATYGVPDQVPITENHPQRPINPYGASKLMVERMLADAGQAYGLRSVALRYFNAAGADPDGEIGEDHNPETHLIPLVLDAASGRRSHIAIFGDDYDTVDGTCIRDYIHVTDLANAHILALKHLEHPDRQSRDEYFTAFNLGNGRGFSVKEVVNTAARVTGKSIPVQYEGRRSGDPPILIGNAVKVIKTLNWQPQYNKIETIIETAWKWHQKHL